MGANSPQFGWVNSGTFLEANTALGPLDPGSMVGVERLVEGLGSSERNPTFINDLQALVSYSAPGVPCSDAILDSELDQIHGYKPHNVPNPNDPDPASRDPLDLGKTPICKSRDDRTDQLS